MFSIVSLLPSDQSSSAEPAAYTVGPDNDLTVGPDNAPDNDLTVGLDNDLASLKKELLQQKVHTHKSISYA